MITIKTKSPLALFVKQKIVLTWLVDISKCDEEQCIIFGFSDEFQKFLASQGLIYQSIRTITFSKQVLEFVQALEEVPLWEYFNYTADIDLLEFKFKI